MITAAVPSEFQPTQKSSYPAHCGHQMIEQYATAYFQSFPAATDRVFLPVHWTNYHITTGYGQGLERLKQFYRQVQDQYPTHKFWTVCQYDDGTLLNAPDMTVFGAGGNDPSNIPIPLLCDPHPVVPVHHRYIASFVGSATHPVRDQLFAAVKDRNGYFFQLGKSKPWQSPKLVVPLEIIALSPDRARFVGRSRLLSPDDWKERRNHIMTLLFRELMRLSRFALCPRGYGPTSFRLCEALQLGVVPVYISDRFWLPFCHLLDWSKFCILVEPNQIASLPDVLESITTAQYEDMREAGRQARALCLTMEGTCQTIAKILEAEGPTAVG